MADPFLALQEKLTALVTAQSALNWTPPALRKSLDATSAALANIGATMALTASASSIADSSVAVKTDALSLGVGVSASAAASISAGVSLGIGFSSSLSLSTQIAADLVASIAAVASLEAQLATYNATAATQAGTNGVMPPGRKIDQGGVDGALRGLDSKLGETQRKASAAAAAVPIVPITADLRLPRVGAWVADLSIDATEPASGKISFELDELVFVGTVTPGHSGTDGARARCRVVGGSGGLARAVTAKSYSSSVGVSIGSVVRDILRDAGEDLSDLSDGPTLNKKVPRWHVTSGTAGQALTRLANACEGAWRVLRDGTIWFGAETWPEVVPEGTLVDENWADGVLTLAAERADMVPGTVYRGERIEYVSHVYDEKLRTEIRTNSPSLAFGRAMAARQQEVDYSREYPCEVVTQNPDGTLQLLPDDEIMRARGLDHVPIRYGLPGFRARLLKGARCHLAFAAGDPARPFAHNWESDEEFVESIECTAGGRSAPIARLGDTVDVFVAPAVPIAFTGIVTPPGSALAGVMTIATPLLAVISTGNAKLLG